MIATIISKNFRLHELYASPVADRLDIDNTPPPDVVTKLRTITEKILQPVRDQFGSPVVVTSGYRCGRLNQIIGGKPTSQHLTGEAVDFIVPGSPVKTVARFIADNLDFDQLILEFYNPVVGNAGWVHCSYAGDKNRKQVLTFNGKKYSMGLVG